MKFYQLMLYNQRNDFLQNHAEGDTGRLVTNLLLFLKRFLCEIKASDLQLSFNILQWHSTWHVTNCIKY